MEDNKNLSNNDEQELFLKAVEGLKDNNSIGHKKTVKGKVVQFDENDVFIDFDFKSEGNIKRSEFDKEPNIGDEVEAIIVGEDDNNILLSKSEIDKRKSQELIDNAVKNNTAIAGVVKEVIKSGFKVSIMGHQVFCPFSQIDLAKGIKESDYIGKEYDFRIKRKTEEMWSFLGELF